VPTFADRVCHVVSVTDPYGRILGFLDRLLLVSPDRKDFHCLKLDPLSNVRLPERRTGAAWEPLKQERKSFFLGPPYHFKSTFCY
jgi:hypothetical protein